jgi:hypothetical protein
VFVTSIGGESLEQENNKQRDSPKVIASLWRGWYVGYPTSGKKARHYRGQGTREQDVPNIQDNPGEENVTQIVRNDSRLTASKTAEELNMNREAVILILPEDLKRREPFPK